ncbi:MULTISPECIES: hypothetical protein [unclassified Bartonella]|uniref:hypothetical protein n=1 Tax=unclassified Bartonella TaxID=2645622 RepID=UPI00099AB98C|nr:MULTISPECIES: hypothetical protein [unclassified Bartonella]AQX27917.1 hypothetical protein BJB15x_005070 [Bartonella sp. JB15]AQX29196.1 hypothetical protein BJB63x_005040 [Bartonella sp. JB63]
MISIDSFRLNPEIDGYQNPSSHKEKNFTEILQGDVQIPSVRISSKNIIHSNLHGTLSYIQEFTDNEKLFTLVLPSLIDGTHPISSWGSLIEVDASQFQGYDGVPKDHFQVYVPLIINDNQLKDFVHSLVKRGKLLGGTQALFKALENDTAEIYNQSDLENLIGKSVNWKQGNMFGTMWDRRMIDEQSIQQFQQEGKQIFTGAIGSIRFAIIY